jgi:integrase
MKREKAKRGDGVFYRDGSLYISWASASGKRLKRRANGDTLADAREDRREEIRKVNQTKIYGIVPPTDKTFAVVAAEHLAKQKPRISPAGFQRESDIIRLHLEPFFTGSLADIRHATIQKYVTAREADASASTVCKELNIIKGIFRFAVAAEYLPSSPASEVRGPKVRTAEQSYLKTEEFAALLGACPAWVRPLVCFGLATGIRLGNIITLEWGNVDLKNRSLTLPKTKNGDALHVPLNDLAMRVLVALAASVEVKKRMRVFGYEGKHNRISVEFKRAAVRMNLPSLHFHNLRHSFCAHSLMAGNDGITVQKLLGHKTASMTSRYAHLSPAFLQGAAAKLDVAFAGLLPEGDGTQMRTSRVKLLKQRETTRNNDENIQPTQNTQESEINA